MEAIDHRPGLARALLQSCKRLVLDNIVPEAALDLEPTPARDLARLADPQDQQKCDLHDLYPSSRQLYGRIESWKDYFETSLFLEREWIRGKPTIKELRGHEEAVLCVKSLYHGERIVSGDRLGYLKVWCAITGECLKTIKRHMMGISCFAAQGDLLVSGSWVCVCVFVCGELGSLYPSSFWEKEEGGLLARLCNGSSTDSDRSVTVDHL